jgi:hypothetical protein
MTHRVIQVDGIEWMFWDIRPTNSSRPARRTNVLHRLVRQYSSIGSRISQDDFSVRECSSLAE